MNNPGTSSTFPLAYVKIFIFATMARILVRPRSFCSWNRRPAFPIARYLIHGRLHFNSLSRKIIDRHTFPNAKTKGRERRELEKLTLQYPTNLHDKFYSRQVWRVWTRHDSFRQNTQRHCQRCKSCHKILVISPIITGVSKFRYRNYNLVSKFRNRNFDVQFFCRICMKTAIGSFQW